MRHQHQVDWRQDPTLSSNTRKRCYFSQDYGRTWKRWDSPHWLKKDTEFATYQALCAAGYVVPARSQAA